MSNFILLEKIISNSWNVPFYFNRFKKNNLNKKFKAINDLNKYPLTKRKDFKNKNLFSNYKINNIKYTINLKSDLLTQESYLPLSKRDFLNYIELELYKFRLIGVSKNDRCSIINFSQNHTIPMANALIKLGAIYVPLDGDETIIFNNIINFKVTVIFTVAQFLFRFLDYVKLNKLKTSLRIVITTGVKINNFKQIKKDIKKYLGANLYETIGSTELGTFAISCKSHPGYYHFIDKYQFVEIINPQTGKTDTKGEIVITPLWKEDYPLVRYATGDYIELEKNKGCICNYKNKWMFKGIIKRLDNTIRIERFLVPLPELYDKIGKVFLYQYFFDKVLWRLVSPPIFTLLLIQENHSDKILLFIERNKSNLTLRRVNKIKQTVNTVTGAQIKIIYCPKNDLINISPVYQDIRNVMTTSQTKKLLNKYKAFYR